MTLWPFDARLSAMWWRKVDAQMNGEFPREYISRLAALLAREDDLGKPSEESVRACLIKANGDVGDAAGLLLALKSKTSLCSKEACADFLGTQPHLGAVGRIRAWEALEAADWEPLAAEELLGRQAVAPSSASPRSHVVTDMSDIPFKSNSARMSNGHAAQAIETARLPSSVIQCTTEENLSIPPTPLVVPHDVESLVTSTTEIPDLPLHGTGKLATLAASREDDGSADSIKHSCAKTMQDHPLHGEGDETDSTTNTIPLVFGPNPRIGDSVKSGSQMQCNGESRSHDATTVNGVANGNSTRQRWQKHEQDRMRYVDEESGSKRSATPLNERVAFLEGENARLKEQASLANEIRSLVRVNQVLVERIQKLEEENAKLRESSATVPSATNRPPSPNSVRQVAVENPREVHARLEGLSQRWNAFRSQLSTVPSLSRTNSGTCLQRDGSITPASGLLSPAISLRWHPNSLSVGNISVGAKMMRSSSAVTVLPQGIPASASSNVPTLQPNRTCVSPASTVMPKPPGTPLLRTPTTFLNMRSPFSERQWQQITPGTAKKDAVSQGGGKKQ